MKTVKPFKNATRNSITQGFHAQHLANDFASAYGDWLVAPWNAKVLNVRGPENLDGLIDDLQNGCGVKLQSVEDPSLTISYWHCLPIFPVKKGDYVNQGQVVAQMGNTGFVMAGDKIITVDQKLVPPYKGTHVHISMGQTDSAGNYTAQDYSKGIDWLIPVNYDLRTAILAILRTISNLLNK